MANTTAKGAISIHGTNPQFLIDKVVRSRIYDCQYWKETCFALTAESLIDCSIKLKYIGGTYANVRPTEFICLALKLLQLQPEKEIILEYLRAEEFKYLRALAAFYVRLTFTPLNVYQTLEPLLTDYRKLRFRSLDGSYTLTTFDEFIDSLLVDDRVCEIVLPRLTTRKVLEETEGLYLRKSQLGIALGVESDDEENVQDLDLDGSERYVSRSPSPVSNGSLTRNHSPSRSPRVNSDRYISRSPSLEPFISRSPSPEGERIEGDV